ncbi:hypothetical protein FQR65_LT16161 [Abscondita terminalis]|nr:hypothetical protein FQR65_LT16161 [Abscondita terminalis]
MANFGFTILDNQHPEMLLTEESIADIYYHPATKKIYMPQMLKNKVIITDKKELEMNHKQQYNKLYQYGVADAFVGGLYKGTLPLKALKLKGDFFGLGAPDMLDGELTMLDGKIKDFAGGTVVHMSAGFAALAGALVLGKRKQPHHEPSNTAFVLLGTGMLWFGWFGFNAGSALSANSTAALAFGTTTIARHRQ